MYWAAEEAFNQWRNDHHVGFPASMDHVAAYLDLVRVTRGPFAVPTHLSVLGRLYRKQGLPFDTKAVEIQTVVKRARAAIQKRAASRQ